MAIAEETALNEAAPVPTIFGIPQTPAVRTALLSLGAALVVAIMVGVWLWGQQPDYKVLFSNFNDRDGGAIVAQLQTMNVPYKYSESGNAILVPANQVHDARLKLAAQGLPKGGNVGFELMENQKLGISQFLEQVNFQRALEGELARSVESVSSVQSARVHLAIPKAQVFIRDQQKPTASVLLNLYPGRILDQQQVSAIVHLVASSVPELTTKNVTIVDQNGNLLSDPNKQNGPNILDPSQLKYVQDIQQNIIKRVESIIAPIVGPNNVHAEATADVDFSRSEQAAESYRPNSPPEPQAIRSQQSSESFNRNLNPSGIPGALSNQPPAPATAPITASGAAGTTAAASNAALMQKDSTVNYEVDKTIRYTQQPMGGIKRLTVGVVINYKRDVDKNGKVTNTPLTEQEKNEITDLIKEAMGFNKDRGDTVNVVNSPFANPEKDSIVELPFWKQAWFWSLMEKLGKYLLIAIVLGYLFFAYLKPMLYKIMGKEEKDKKAAEEAAAEKARIAQEQAGLEGGEAGEEDEDGTVVNLTRDADGNPIRSMSPYETDLQMAVDLAKNDPKIVANVIKKWVSNE
ncbi:flagellar basal-body MS-ring/collar protein FliF [Undibacterium sp.]|jgi:flagellar M-ring protein FliF|uniref:flagellar basal-body MS-ring/collar protein FliF n=1 Tax=Undibacterium sp. TaxID=1914977 RepID=UPI002CDD5C97|nr:flagellar basal-body MS-ring/collar protein FliF [Undibacterium sp.]HTD06452.1 flagellar basal-body MS-ring/collar protein FliF [Undibacterium sp.]